MIAWLKRGKRGEKKKPTPQNRYKFTQLAGDLPRPYGVNHDGSGADYHYASRYEIYAQAEYARDLDRNNVLVRHTLDRLTNNVVQGGFAPEPSTGRKALDRQLKDKWETWTMTPAACDLQGEWDFLQMSRLCFREAVISGDILALPLNDGRLELVEQHRIRSWTNNKDNMIVHGIELTQARRRVAYYVSKDVIPLNQPVAINDLARRPAWDNDGNKTAFFIYYPNRISQTRGYTKLAGIRDYLLMFDQVHQARLGQQQSLASMAIIRERDIDFELPDGVEEHQTLAYDDCAGIMQEVHELPRNMMYTTFNGERVSALNATVPSMSQLDHLTAIEDLIAINLELPPIVLRMDATATNFSGWRGALETAKLGWKSLQRGLCQRLHEPVYHWKLRQWTEAGSPFFDPTIASAREQIGDERFFSVEFIFPTWASVQPEVDTRVDVESMANTTDSPRSIQRKRGRNWSKIARETVEDRSMAIELALKEATRLNDKYPDAQLRWTDFIGLPQAAGANISRSSQEDPEAETTTETTTDAV